MGIPQLFGQYYATRKAELRGRLLAGEVPVIVRVGPELIFLHDRRRHREQVTGEEYDRLKHMCHVPLALYLRLAELVDEPMTARDVRELQRIAEWLDALEPQDDPGRAIVHCVRSVVGRALEARHVTADVLQQLARDPSDAIEACIDRAAMVELSAVHEIVERWTATFDDEHWAQLRVVVCANHQARYKQATKRYFQRRLGEPQREGAAGEHHVTYAENAATLDEALDLLATQMLDTELGTAFRNSPLALQQDVLGDAAERALDVILGSGS